MNNTILMLCVLGIILSSYLTYLHYVPEELDASFCNISDYLSCATVNKSRFATLFGIPVALLGIIGFVIMGVLAINKRYPSGTALFFLSLSSLIFMLYLTGAEIFIIGAVCVLCVMVAAITLFIFLLSWENYGRQAMDFLRSIRIE